MQNAAISFKVPNEGEDKQEAAARFDFHAARVAILSELNRIKKKTGERERRWEFGLHFLECSLLGLSPRGLTT